MPAMTLLRDGKTFCLHVTPTEIFLRGVRIYTRSMVGWIKRLEGDCRKKKGRVRPGSGKIDLYCTVLPAVAISLVLLTKVFCQKPSCLPCTPGPGMIDTLSHYLMTALVERERAVEWYWEIAGDLHTHTHTHVAIVCRCVCVHALEAKFSGEGSLRGADVLQIMYIVLQRHTILGSRVYGTVHWFLNEMNIILCGWSYHQAFISLLDLN